MPTGQARQTADRLCRDVRRHSMDVMSDTQLERLLSFAEGLAHAAGQIALDQLGHSRIRRKADRSVVTDADEAMQALMLERIAAGYPDHAVVAEESTKYPAQLADPEAARFCWIIDPLDGTRNYSRGLAIFSISISLLEHGQPVAGLVFNPVSRECYSAIAGQGARLNSKPITVREQVPGDDILIGVPSGRRVVTPRAVHEWLDKMVLRNIGSTALHLAMVAGGALDAAFCQECKVWDIAAGALLVQEAGGLVTDLQGQPHFPFSFNEPHDRHVPYIAASPNLHPKLLADLQP